MEPIKIEFLLGLEDQRDIALIGNRFQNHRPVDTHKASPWSWVVIRMVDEVLVVDVDSVRSAISDDVHFELSTLRNREIDVMVIVQRPFVFISVESHDRFRAESDADGYGDVIVLGSSWARLQANLDPVCFIKVLLDEAGHNDTLTELGIFYVGDSGQEWRSLFKLNRSCLFSAFGQCSCIMLPGSFSARCLCRLRRTPFSLSASKSASQLYQLFPLSALIH